MKEEKKEQKESKKPDESSSINVDAHLKIFDPNTEEVFVNKRS